MPQHRSTRLRLEALEDRLTPSTGGLLDPTFGSGGQVLSPLAGSTDTYAVTLQPDGKIVIGGTNASFIVGRYNADGSLDTSFGSGGYTVTAFGGNSERVWAVAVQPQADGTSKILAAGETVQTQKHGKTVTSTVEIALARYNANGTLDTTFGTNGKVITNPAGQGDYARSMAVDGSGRIVVAAESNLGVATLVRYTPNGALDTSFGTGGALVTNVSVFSGNVRMALQSDGKIVLASDVNNASAVTIARFNVNGTADSTFGSSGVVTTNQVGAQDAVAIQGDGKIVVAELDSTYNQPSGYYLFRYNPDGTLDAGFGSSGEVTLINPYGWEYNNGTRLAGVAVQTDGKIVAGGDLYDPVLNQTHFVAVRVDTTGALDTGYGNSGWASTQFSSGDRSFAMALQPDGRLVFAGVAGNNEVALVRFLGSAPQIGSFTASSNPATAGSLVTLAASGITDGNPNSTITQVAFYVDSNGNGVLDSGDTLLGYATQTSPGVWTYSFTVNLTSGMYTLFAQAQDNDGVLGDPLALSLQVM
jgi:uncharacterized delta-60 repeat protein